MLKANSFWRVLTAWYEVAKTARLLFRRKAVKGKQAHTLFGHGGQLLTDAFLDLVWVQLCEDGFVILGLEIDYEPLNRNCHEIAVV